MEEGEHAGVDKVVEELIEDGMLDFERRKSVLADKEGLVAGEVNATHAGGRGRELVDGEAL